MPRPRANTYCLKCPQHAMCTELCTPLKVHLGLTCRSKVSAQAIPFADLNPDLRAVVADRLYGIQDALE